MGLVCFAVVLYIILLTGYHTGGAMSSAYAKYPARYLFVPRSTARINTGRGCPLLPVIFVSPRYAAVRCIAAGMQYMCCQPCWILAETMQYIAVGEVMYVCKMCSILPSVVQYMCCQPCWILAVTMQYIAVGEVIYVCQLCSIFAGRAVYLPSAVLYTAGDYAIYRCRRGYVRMPTMQYIRRRSCRIFAVSCA